MKQTVLTIITEIDPAKRPELERILLNIHNNLHDNLYIPFSALTLVHFTSFFISDDQRSTPLLIFENNFDGDISPYLDELLSVAGKGIHQIYQCCPAYKQQNYNQDYFKQFLTLYIVHPNAYHIGNVGRTAKDIKENQQLRESLQNFLDQLLSTTPAKDLSTDELRAKMQEFITKSGDPNFCKILPPHQTLMEKIIPRLKQVLALCAVIVLIGLRFPWMLILTAVVTTLLVLKLRSKETSDSVSSISPTVKDIEKLIGSENQIMQNHLANVTQIKSGPFRLTLLRVVLFGANLLARTSTKGKLSGIPSIHFAHWSIINNDTQLLFVSNYDGSWSSYLDDFIDKAATGLTGIWSNTQGFPRTRFLVMDGARDELGFKAYARAHQVPSLVWYSAYSDLTVQNIDKDSAIRENMFNKLSESETKAWLKLF